MTQITISEQEKEVQREIAMRKKAGLVAKGKMTEADAAHRIEVMEAVLQTLKEKSEPMFI